MAVKALLCALWLQPCGQSWLSCQALNASGKREMEEKRRRESQAVVGDKGLWAESVSQGDKEKWDKNRCRLMTPWQGESGWGEARKGVMKTTVEGKGDVRHLRWEVEADYLRGQKEGCSSICLFISLNSFGQKHIEVCTLISVNASSEGEVIRTILTSSSSRQYPWLWLHSFHSGKGTSPS